MKVLSEEKLCSYLDRVLALSKQVLELLPEHGSGRAADEVLDAYHQLVNDLSQERENDNHLDDDSWNWIWQDKPNPNHIQVYGRLAWINLQLLELL